MSGENAISLPNLLGYVSLRVMRGGFVAVETLMFMMFDS
jgi:hypothetical protein